MTANNNKPVAGFVANVQGDADKANLPAVVPAYEKADVIASLFNATAKEQEAAFMAMTVGEVAGFAGRGGKLAESAYKVIALKLNAKHGEGWADRKYGGRTLTDLEKAERDALKADKEAIIAAIKASGHSNAHKAFADIRGWAAGRIGQPRDANINKARATVAWLKDEAPKWYKRLNNAEDITDAEATLMDHIGAYLEAVGVDLRALLEGK